MTEANSKKKIELAKVRRPLESLKLDEHRADWLLASMVIALVGLVVVAMSYQYKPEWLIDIGGIGDQAYVQGFNGDERVAEYSYRWTTGDSIVNLPGVADGAARLVSVRLSGWRPVGKKPPVVRIFEDGQQVASFQSSGTMQTYSFSIPGRSTPTGDIELRIESASFTPAGDARSLGVMVDSITARPLGTAFSPLAPPPLPVVGYVIVAALILELLLISLHAGARTVLISAGLFELLLGIGLTLQRVIAAAYLPWLAVALAVVGSAYNLPAIGRALQSHISRVAHRRTALYMLTGFLVLLAVFEVVLITNMDFIGHADYADSGVVARNIVSGRGMTVDYAAQFYQQYPAGIRHAVDTWPPLEPLLLVPAFLVGGANVVAAKVPNLLLSMVLALSIYLVGARLFDRRVGFAAAVLTAIHPYFVGMVAYPINDLPFAVFFLLFLFTLFSNADAGRPPEESTSGPVLGRLDHFWGTIPSFALSGVFAGLLILAKPTGALLVVAIALLCLVYMWRRRGPARSISWLAITAAVALVVVSPWFVRNLALFHSPLYSTESYDAWILKYNPPWENIYNIYYGNLPGPGLLIRYGFDWVTYVISQEFGNLAKDFVDGSTFSYFAFALALLGAFVLNARQRRLLWLLLASFAVMAVFVCVYWHYEDRYFLFFIPWLYLLGMNFLFWVNDLVAQRARDRGAATWVGGFLVPLVFVALAWPSVNQLRGDFSVYTSPTAIVQASDWIADQTPQEAVVMTRNPWEVSFHSERRSVMIPNADFDQIMTIARRYGVTYLQLDHLSDWKLRPALKDLYLGKEVLGFKKVYESEGIIIYRLPT
ncbi:MAG: glycosyltransferase family 39 protein [Chloroflexi bacterium]|nr:glycosyltransferase family 39 protein [Chloroflexota bacterium]